MYIVSITVVNVEKRQDPKGTSQTSLKYSEDPTHHQTSTVIPVPRRSFSRGLSSTSSTLESGVYRQVDTNNGHGTIVTDRSPLMSDQRQYRPGDVNAPTNVVEYNQYTDREYTIPPRKQTRTSDIDDIGYYVGQIHDDEPPRTYVESFILAPF